MNTKCIWIGAPFKEEGYWKIEQVQIGTTVNKVAKGLFNKKIVDEVSPVYEDKKVWVVECISDCKIDGKKFSENINQEIVKLEDEGYEIVSITPITSGSYKYDYEAPIINAGDRASFGWGYGFSYTEGVNILARPKMCITKK